jgi:hypothetical protein
MISFVQLTAKVVIYHVTVETFGIRTPKIRRHLFPISEMMIFSLRVGPPGNYAFAG